MKLKKILIALSLLVSMLAVPFNSNASTTVKHSVAIASTYKLSAKLSNTRPKQYSRIYLTVKGIPSGTFKATFHYKTKNTYYSGKVGHAFPVRISRATKNFRVKVDVSVVYKGKAYRTQTSFLPR
jgi:competence protein ComEC